MAVMTKADAETVYPSGMTNSAFEVDRLTGVGVDVTTTRNAVTSAQLWVTGGHIQSEGAGEVEFYSATTLIGSVELTANQLTYDLVPAMCIYTKAGEALILKNVDGATVNIVVASQAVKDGEHLDLRMLG